MAQVFKIIGKVSSRSRVYQADTIDFITLSTKIQRTVTEKLSQINSAKEPFACFDLKKGLVASTSPSESSSQPHPEKNGLVRRIRLERDRKNEYSAVARIRASSALETRI
jgi:hypothetical protein